MLKIKTEKHNNLSLAAFTCILHRHFRFESDFQSGFDELYKETHTQIFNIDK